VGGKGLATLLGKSIAYELDQIAQKASIAIAALETLVRMQLGLASGGIIEDFKKNLAEPYATCKAT
jgi:hypothetical protein